ncbi:MAG: HlyD family secretion protein [Gammaproteobacteria bacterium]
MAEEKADEKKPAGAPPRPWLRRLRITMMILGPAILLAVVLWYYLAHRGYVSTDDAFVQANVVTISSQVAGRVITVAVHENEQVAKGAVLFTLDAAPYEAAYEAAQAKLATTADRVQAMKAQYQALDAQIAGAESQVAYLTREVKRQGPLAKKNVITNAKLDALRTELEQAEKKVATLKAQRAEALASLGGNPDQALADNSDYRAAAAALVRAKLNLSYTTIRAPADGVAGPVVVRPGDVLAPGRAALPLVETGMVWIKANFKETALTHMRPGEPATISVDSYPDRSWKGRVASISPASGESFALLPPQNASGNWVKVVQRIPVRIEIERRPGDPVLRSGMSAEVTVYVGGDKNNNSKQ